MDNITEKIARVTDLSTYTDITPEYLKKVFDDIGGSPEKLRTILNLWFTPGFKPSFIEPQTDAFSGLHDIGFIGSPDVDQTPRPLRLIDLETGNIVDVWNTSPLDAYCMLSHRWKGDEITLAHIKRARMMHLERTKNGSRDIPDSDISIVLEQCKLDVLEQENIILSLLGDRSEGKTVGDLLAMSINAGGAAKELNDARKDRDRKKSNVERSRMEKNMFDHLAERIQQNIGGNKTAVADPSLAAISDEAESEIADSGVPASSVVDEAEEEYAKAQQAFEEKWERNNKANDEAMFLRDNRPLSDSLNELVRLLQRWKSAMKLDSSMKEAREIFRTKLYPKRGASYIWSDTCCIDKLNYGELSQSLSLMGDWYANAEFCLVHLDTDLRVEDAIRNWNLFKGEMGEVDKAGKSQQAIASFSAIGVDGLEWATRAWTLQELVMSKMAFFTNAEGKLLSRPVESLGYVYPLIPFIDIYIAGSIADMFSKDVTKETTTNTLRAIVDSEALESLLDKNDVVVDKDSEDESASERVKDGLRLISILHALGFVFPTEMTTETAIPEMTRSVYLSAWNLVKGGHDGSNARGRDVLRELKSQITFELQTGNVTDEDEVKDKAKNEDKAEAEAQYVINFLLFSLVEATKGLVVSDRNLIAEFGRVHQLESWKQGITRTGFSAQQVLQLSCQREATVPVDHVYSLMGILGVRFQSFHAEGYAKALSRLLDEVVINHNDVSVFNWSGVGMGSPVRGRSMYPAFHEAYVNEKDHGRRYNMMISTDVQRKRKEVMLAYNGVITLLRDTIDCIKSKGREGLPLEWVQQICAFLRESSFEVLRPELDSISKIIRYIQLCGSRSSPTQTAPETKKSLEGSPSSGPGENVGFGRSFSKSSLPTMKLQPNLKTPKLPSFGFSGISKPSFSRHHSEPVESDSSPVLVSQDPKKLATPQVPEWLSLDDQVKTYLGSLSSPGAGGKAQCELPIKIQQLDPKTSEPQAATKSQDSRTGDLDGTEDLTCPNPIIINSSGIEGIFDIQRIVVTMIDREKLSRQVARATSPKQKISGWCIISTGFASVVVNFACDQHLLKKQLDIEQAVQDMVIKEDRASKLHGNLEIKGSAKPKEQDSSSSKVDRPSDTSNETDKNNATSWKPTEEEKTIVRILDFIQEPQLHLVAGEWVLARFSGARGAKWFLCYLELGSTHSFYGHRIAASDIDFDNSAIEPGLMNAWKTYMNRKKRKMCNVLNKYISSSASATKGQERLNKSSKIANENYARLWDAGNQGLDRVMSMGSSTSTSLPTQPFDEGGNKNTKIEEDADSEDDEVPGAGLFEDLIDQGKEAATALGEYTVLAVYERICEMQAKHLDKHLSTSVLKRTPKSLQTAVESVDENKGFLPAMYHSSRRVHMF
ncbi:hypothetical protein FPOAC1_007572 [Fusarium poae]|uniref:Heterokaryon incompatibility domain-containing protein n=1 Tax=Fusarium poae TaxID=36050 RepID=A0A1B8AQS2_FUSPO|nr:hypothetical protein FPOAC1_007572 [Fusarium poae]KAG8668195.1 hypothetical protein FPOAC1_007572 [Fusarium poae]OBS22868.1 hypothetical protein FPOA_09191 [Fusarium poae]